MSEHVCSSTYLAAQNSFLSDIRYPLGSIELNMQGFGPSLQLATLLPSLGDFFLSGQSLLLQVGIVLLLCVEAILQLCELLLLLGNLQLGLEKMYSMWHRGCAVVSHSGGSYTAFH